MVNRVTRDWWCWLKREYRSTRRYGSTGATGPKEDKGDPAIDIDIVAELCKPMEMVEQYRRGAYAR